MTTASVIIDELEAALKVGSTDRRIEVLRRVTSLFLNNAKNYSADQAALFDDVFGWLVKEIESTALVELSRTLAPIATAPPEIIRRLAWDDKPEVAAPVLAMSERLSEGDLVELAKSKGHAHLVQIAARPSLTEAVTDVLVECADPEVAKTLAGNSGARFSETGLWQLVKRADEDDVLAEGIATRSDLPTYLFRQLVTQAADKVRQKLLASAKQDTRRAVEQVLGNISDRYRKAALSRDYAEAQRKISALGQDTARIKVEVLGFAQNEELPELIVALAMLSAMPVELVEQLMHEGDSFGLLVLCKATAMDLTIMHAVLAARPGPGLSAEELDELSATYLKLSISSAQRALRFWQTHKKFQPRSGPAGMAAPKGPNGSSAA